MVAKKKNAETVEVVAPSVIAVDARKLSHGLKMTFEGMAMVFDSLGVDMGVPAVKTDDAKTATPADPIDPAADKLSSAEETVSEEHDTDSQDTTPEAESSVAESEGEAQDTAEEVQPDAADPAEPTSDVSIDDITKIIVQKIKQNRKNNEKIGSILKTYGVAKVGDLPASKYEAFLTDLSAI